MTRKHFETIALLLRANKASEDMCWNFAQHLADYNDRFDPHRFMVACGFSNYPVGSN